MKLKEKRIQKDRAGHCDGEQYGNSEEKSRSCVEECKKYEIKREAV